MHSSILTVPIRRTPRILQFWRLYRRTSNDHPRRRHREQGMTLLEMMIVLAILGLVMGLLVGPRVVALFIDAKEQIAAAAVKKYANEAYPTWVTANPGQSCPADIEALGPYMNQDQSKDPWDQSYRLYCGASLPKGVRGGIAIVSNGPDAKPDTEDDIKSWK